MAEYIDKEALMQRIIDTTTETAVTDKMMRKLKFSFVEVLSLLADRQVEIIQIIKKFPATDVAPARHWKREYEVERDNARVFTDLSDVERLYTSPTLPTVEIQKGERIYAVTDVKLLNETAVDVLNELVLEAAKSPDCEAVAFWLPEDMGVDDIEIIADIALGCSCGVRDDDERNMRQERLVVNAVNIYDDIITFQLIKRHAEYIFEYAQGKKEINFYDMAVDVARRIFDDVLD